MPKWKSVLIKKEKKEGGQVVDLGEVVMVPMDDAAILEPEVELAIEHKAWLKEDGKTPYTKAEWEDKKIQVKEKYKHNFKEFMKRRANG